MQEPKKLPIRKTLCFYGSFIWSKVAIFLFTYYNLGKTSLPSQTIFIENSLYYTKLYLSVFKM